MWLIDVAEIVGGILALFTLGSILWGTISKYIKRKGKHGFLEGDFRSNLRILLDSVSFKFPLLILAVLVSFLIMWIVILEVILSGYYETANSISENSLTEVGIVVYEFDDTDETFTTDKKFNNISKAFYNNLSVKFFDSGLYRNITIFPAVDCFKTHDIEPLERLITAEEISGRIDTPFFFIWGEKLSENGRKFLYINYEYTGPDYFNFGNGKPPFIEKRGAYKFCCSGSDDILGTEAAEYIFTDIVIFYINKRIRGDDNVQKSFELIESILNVQEYPENKARLLVYKGRLYEYYENENEAFREYERAVDISELYGFTVDQRVYITLGRMYLDRGDKDKPLKYFESGLNGTCEDSDIYYWLAEYYNSERDINKAIYNCEKALYYKPHNSDALLLSAKLHEDLGDYSSAIDELTRFVSVKKSDDPEIYIKLAKDYARIGDFEASLDNIDLANQHGFSNFDTICEESPLKEVFETEQGQKFLYDINSAK